jgi:hypothetical protein
MNLQASIDLNCVVVKEGNEYCVKSEDRSKNLGCKPSKEGAKRRLRQVEYFKHMKGGGVGSGRHPIGTKVKINLPDHEKHGKVGRVGFSFGKESQKVHFSDKSVHIFHPKYLVPTENKKDLKGGGQGSGRHKGTGTHAEKLLQKLGYKRDDRIVNSPYGKAYRHPDRPHERVHVADENAEAVDAGGPGSGRKKGSSKKKWSQMSEEERREAARQDSRQMTFPSVDISKYGLSDKDMGHVVDHGPRKTGFHTDDPVAKLERIGRR